MHKVSHMGNVLAWLMVLQDLRRSNFTSADCRRANFKNSNLQGAYFSEWQQLLMPKLSYQQIDISAAAQMMAYE
jgi:uncharacterized protein YjbI with pentapeptide repeats